MLESDALFKYIYHEDLYLIEEQEVAVEDQQSIGQEAEQETTSVVKEAKPVTFFGENEKGILIMVNDPDSEYLNSNDLEFLMKIIESGLKYSRSDIALVNTSKHAPEQVIDEIDFSHLISFGCEVSKIKQDTSQYHPLDHDGKKVIFAHDLKVIACDREKKKLLWNCLKTIFNV